MERTEKLFQLLRQGCPERNFSDDTNSSMQETAPNAPFLLL